MIDNTTRNVISIQNQFQIDFDKKFRFVEVFCSEIWKLEGKIGLDRVELDKMEENHRKFVISVIQIATAADTALSGSLALLRVGIPAESLALQRIVFEAGIIIYFMSLNEDNCWKVYLSLPGQAKHYPEIFQEKFNIEEKRDPWKAVRNRALNYILNNHPKHAQYRQIWDFLNKHGAHLTPEHMLHGSVDILGDILVSRSILPKIDMPFLKALNLHPAIHLSVTESLIKFFKKYKCKEAKQWAQKCEELNKRCINEILPKLKEIGKL